MIKLKKIKTIQSKLEKYCDKVNQKNSMSERKKCKVYGLKSLKSHYRCR